MTSLYRGFHADCQFFTWNLTSDGVHKSKVILQGIISTLYKNMKVIAEWVGHSTKREYVVTILNVAERRTKLHYMMRKFAAHPLCLKNKLIYSFIASKEFTVTWT